MNGVTMKESGVLAGVRTYRSREFQRGAKNSSYQDTRRLLGLPSHLMASPFIDLQIETKSTQGRGGEGRRIEANLKVHWNLGLGLAMEIVPREREGEEEDHAVHGEHDLHESFHGLHEWTHKQIDKIHTIP